MMVQRLATNCTASKGPLLTYAPSPAPQIALSWGTGICPHRATHTASYFSCQLLTSYKSAVFKCLLALSQGHLVLLPTNFEAICPHRFHLLSATSVYCYFILQIFFSPTIGLGDWRDGVVGLFQRTWDQFLAPTQLITVCNSSSKRSDTLT